MWAVPIGRYIFTENDVIVMIVSNIDANFPHLIEEKTMRIIQQSSFTFFRYCMFVVEKNIALFILLLLLLLLYKCTNVILLHYSVRVCLFVLFAYCFFSYSISSFHVLYCLSSRPCERTYVSCWRRICKEKKYF